jgi:disulfide bond formation protein DsbB
MNQKQLHDLANLFGLWAISLVLVVVFHQQITLHELPCPLCLLQRAALIGVGLSLMANLIMGVKTKHYGLALLFALVGAAAAIRQVLLHIQPGQEGYGSPLWGLHLYTWGALIFIAVMICIGFALLLSKGIDGEKASLSTLLVKVSSVFFLALILLNAGSAFLECGVWQCVDDPVRYELLTRLEQYAFGAS